MPDESDSHPPDEPALQAARIRGIEEELYGIIEDAGFPRTLADWRRRFQEGIVSAIAHTRGDGSPGATIRETGEGSPGKRGAEEAKRLLDWASASGRLLIHLPQPWRPGAAHDYGKAEHYAFPATDRWFKVTKGSGFPMGAVIRHHGERVLLMGATPVEYLQRLLDQEEFSPTLIAFHGVYHAPDGSIAVVTSQRDFKGRHALEQSVVDRYFVNASAGFQKVDDRHYYREHDNVAVFDAKPDNGVIDDEGHWIGFDLVVQRPNPPLKDAILRQIQRVAREQRATQLDLFEDC